MKLDGFKDVFEKVLDKEDYSMLEKALERGLELEEDSVSQILGAGSLNLQELVRELPSRYKNFKKLGKEKARLEKYGEKPKFSDFVPSFTGKGYWLWALDVCVSSALTGLLFFDACNSLSGMPSLLASFGTDPFLNNAYVFTLSFFASSVMSDRLQGKLFREGEIKHYHHAFHMPVCLGLYSRGRSRKRGVDKLENSLVEGLESVYRGDGE